MKVSRIILRPISSRASLARILAAHAFLPLPTCRDSPLPTATQTREKFPGVCRSAATKTKTPLLFHAVALLHFALCVGSFADCLTTGFQNVEVVFQVLQLFVELAHFGAPTFDLGIHLFQSVLIHTHLPGL